MPSLTAIAIAGIFVPVREVAAAPTVGQTSSMNVYEMNSTDPFASDTIKTLVIEDYAKSHSDVEFEDIDIDNSDVSITGLNMNKPGIQAVTLKVSLAKIGDTTKTVGYTETQKAAINVVKSSNPTIKLKKSSVTVNNGDTWNPSSYISTISDDSGTLPVLKETDNVDMNVDGDYYASYTVVDTEGNSSTVVLNVTVKTPQEVLDARAAAEEEARLKAEEEQRKKEEEEAKKKAEEERLASINQSGNGNPTAGISGYNPYGGGWSNCTFGAWQAAYQATGISLPNFGNAGGWVGSAASYGYATGSAPAVGSIAVYSHHVAYVDGVSADGSAVHIVEGGFNGGYNERWVSAGGTGTQALRGYIYLGG